MSNIKSNNENSLKINCITISELSNKTNEKEDLVSTFNDNKKIKRFTKRKRKNESCSNRICCSCKKEVSIKDSYKFKTKGELIDIIDSNEKSKGIINKSDINFMRFKENKIICKTCFDDMLECKDDPKSKIKKIFFYNKKRGKITPKIRKKDKQNNINNANLEDIDDKGQISSINNGLKQNNFNSIDIKEYENCLSYIKQYIIGVFRVVLIFGENYTEFLWNMNNKFNTFLQSYIQTKNILQIMIDTGKIVALNFKNVTDCIINKINLLKGDSRLDELSKNRIQKQLDFLINNTNQIFIKLTNFFNNLNVLITFLNGKDVN